MVYYIDTDVLVTENMFHFISIGMISEGLEYVAYNIEFNAVLSSPWIQENVVPYLPDSESSLWRDPATIRNDLEQIIGDDPMPELWSLSAGQTYVMLSQLWGGNGRLSGCRWPCYDLQQWCGSVPHPLNRRDPLEGARLVRRTWHQHIGRRQRAIYQPGDVVDVDYLLPISGRRNRFLCRAVVEGRVPYDEHTFNVTCLGNDGKRTDVRIALHSRHLRLIYRRE